VLSISNPRFLIGWPKQAVNGQAAPALLFGGIHPRVLSQQIHGHEEVALMQERMPQPGQAIHIGAARTQ